MRKILVADDSAMILSTLRTILTHWGYEVETAENGEEALEKIEKSLPDILITDIMMPGLHGFNVIQKVKSSEKTRNIKTIIYTGKNFESEKIKSAELGVDAFIAKVNGVEVLRETIEKLLCGDAECISVEFFGTRGSIPTPGRNYEAYGGNTSCVAVNSAGRLLIFDAGTGMRELGMGLVNSGSPVDAGIFISHTHWDHIQGFPFFLPAYDPKNKFTIYGPSSMDRTLEETFKVQFDPNYFPVSLEGLRSSVNFQDLNEETFSIDDISVSTIYLNHPGMTLGYRIESRGKKICYITDNEITPSVGGNSFNDFDTGKLADFIAGSHLCIIDAQYTDEEYKQKKGWGHSSVSEVLKVAEGSGVEELILFHHDPMHTDEQIDKIVASAADGCGIALRAAKEKTTVKV